MSSPHTGICLNVLHLTWCWVAFVVQTCHHCVNSAVLVFSPEPLRIQHGHLVRETFVCSLKMRTHPLCLSSQTWDHQAFVFSYFIHLHSLAKSVQIKYAIMSCCVRVMSALNSFPCTVLFKNLSVLICSATQQQSFAHRLLDIHTGYIYWQWFFFLRLSHCSLLSILFPINKNSNPDAPKIGFGDQVHWVTGLFHCFTYENVWHQNNSPFDKSYYKKLEKAIVFNLNV